MADRREKMKETTCLLLFATGLLMLLGAVGNIELGLPIWKELARSVVAFSLMGVGVKFNGQ